MYWVLLPRSCVVCVCVSRHLSLDREARHEVSPPSPTASDGAHVGTLSAIRSPLCATSERESANWTVLPKNGASLKIELVLTVRANRRLPGRRTLMPALASPPRFSLKNLICEGPGLESWIVQATTRPSWGTRNTPRLGPTLAW